MDVSTCARLLWTATRDLIRDPTAPDALRLLRERLAEVIVRTDGEGFPPFDSVSRAEVDAAIAAADPAVQECTQAAEVAQNRPRGPHSHAVLWNRGPDGLPAPDVPVRWARAVTGPDSVGPVRRLPGNDQVFLFLYTADQIAGVLSPLDAAEAGGFFAGVTPPAATMQNAPLGWRLTGVIVVVLGIALFVFAALKIRDGSQALQRAYEVAQGLNVAEAGLAANMTSLLGESPITRCREERTVKGEDGVLGAPSPEARRVCDQAMAIGFCAGMARGERTEPERAKAIAACINDPVKRRADLELVVDKEGRMGGLVLTAPRPGSTGIDRLATVRVSLFYHLLAVMGGIVLLLIGTGFASKGRWSGIVIDDRNRMSLSASQLATWTVILLGGYTALSLWNVSLMALGSRDLAQVQSVAALPGFTGLFPTMQAELWLVLGIVIGAPIASALLLKPKRTPGAATAAAPPAPPTPAVDPTTVTEKGKLDARTEADQAGLLDLVTGEKAADRDHADIGRVQNLTITLLLVVSYFQFLMAYVQDINMAVTVRALALGLPVFAEMPRVDPAFVGLLAISHAAYLTLKSVDATDGGGQKQPSK